MSDAEGIVCEHALAGEPFTRETAQRAVAEANLLREMMQQPGWVHAMQRWDELAAARRGMVNCKPERLAELQQIVLGRDAAQQIVADMLELGDEAGQWLREHARDAAREPMAATFMRMDGTCDEEAAALALEQRRRIEALVVHPGWKILARHIADRTHAEASRLIYDRPEEAMRRQATIAALKAPIKKLERLVNLGADAEAFFDMQAKEREESGNA